MIHQIRTFLTYLFLAGSFYSCNGQTLPSYNEEQQLRKEMDDWMKPYRGEQSIHFDQWIDWVENHIDDVWRHPVFKHMDHFYNQHRNQYIRLRKSDLERYQPAPKVLPGYERISDFYSDYEGKGFTMKDGLQLSQRIANFRTLAVADTRSTSDILSAFALEYLKAEKGASYDQITNKYAYGEMLFAEPIQGNQWQLTFLNRMYAVKFNWDITDNRVSDPELWVYTGGKQASDWLDDKLPKANTDVQRLSGELAAFRWALYDQEDGEVVDYNRMLNVLSEKLGEYYQAHRPEYIRLRNEALVKYPEPNKEIVETFDQDAPELKLELLSVLERTDDGYKLPNITAAYEIDGRQIINSLYYMAMRYVKNYAEYNLTSWIVGQDIYAKQIEKDTWEVLFFYRNFLISFRWNIATNELSGISAKAKEKSKI